MSDRSVSTDALATLGTIIDDTQKRDAIHLAVIPMVARAPLSPGDHVSKDCEYVMAYAPAAVGIVDPFLKTGVEPGQRFWCVIYPRVITSLRHVWSHPAFAQESEPFIPPGASESEAWIRNLCDDMDIGYSEMMSGADAWVETFNQRWGRDYVTQQGSTSWQSEFPEQAEEFWRHYEIVRGVNVPQDRRGSFFSCSC